MDSSDRVDTKGSNPKRPEFLLHMYDQMFNDINTHILVVWQSVSVLVGAFAILALTEKQVITLDVATALIILIAAWLIGHLYDASYWYNRNLVIIANIERQFLETSDLVQIHYYFGKHRKKGTMITHLRIQYCLSLGIGLVVLSFHFFTRVLPGFSLPISGFEPVRTLPYLILIPALWALRSLKRQRDQAYAEFVGNSPGKVIDTEGITFGVGHPSDAQQKT
ncbi:MAG TPA: hypothetical protein VGQ49_15210 [Bryobacteraceae bacterium]|jgi:hypothetical protein|nr:hypothetical protein [Bryobacteraceae bacterium]